MAVANAALISPSSYCISRFNCNIRCQEDHKVFLSGFPAEPGSGFCSSTFCVGSHAKRTDISSGKRRTNAVDTRIVDNIQTKSTIEIPVSCYQLIGVPDKAEKDEIVKSVMALKKSEIEEGYTMDVVVSRQDLLMDVRDKLLFEPEYAGNLKEKIPPKASLRIPWSWFPGALCLLQEVGESKLVLDIGRVSLQHQEAKPYAHDLLLSMALAECAIAKIGFEKNKVSQGFEALARAQCLLRSRPSLAKMTLLSQIEQSLEELAPACTLELLGMPQTPENAHRRQGAIAALRELLRQGLDVETSCQVQDWPSFLNQAFSRLLAMEMVDLLPWHNLAATRKNKKTLESQNQRVVIDSNCFYRAFIAHVALGFSSKQKDLINEAKNICECLTASEGIDLKFEEAFCLFLLGQGTEAEAVKQLKQLELNSNSNNSVSRKAIVDVSATNLSLEMWLKGYVLASFPDTQDCSPSLVNFFNAEKRTSGSKRNKEGPETLPTIGHRPLSASVALERRDFEEPHSYTNSSSHLGFAVKQLTPTDLQSSLLSGKKDNGSNLSEAPAQLKRNLGNHRNGFWDSYSTHASHIFGKITYVTVLGCIVFASFKVLGVNSSKERASSRWASTRASGNIVWTADSSVDHNVGSACVKESKFTDGLKRLLAMIRFMHLSDGENQRDLWPASTSPTPHFNMHKRPMPVEEAEALIKQWQTIKAEALGPSHLVHSLTQVLDESMLAQWQALADTARERSCYWRIILLKVSVLRADILSDWNGAEVATIESLLEEAAELVDASQEDNPNYYSTYLVKYVLKRQDDGTWKFCEGAIEVP
ncbi:plastid division protein CDP1, chloroplastic isoform X1 [Prosopis cineraria]|uniref:plastid division protein CDP1, chloroplastic isoform X1 n=1 Tax=Prosopis cineraria TaxID=364024 RepID=UPI00240F60CB|nr:plastid division protein CDP1, chloroplastic isoform X1 [Prosopis cineraria]